jgi:hypothetical protein
VNPRERIALNPEYAQTRPEAAVTDGERVYIASSSAYGKLGGALSVITPGTSQVEVYPQLLRDLDLNSLAWDRKTGLLWGGTNRWGQMRAHPPTQPDSLLYAFDPGRRQVTRRLVLWPGTDVTTVLGVSGDGLLIAASGREVAFVDTVRGEILYRGAFPVGIPNRIRLGADGYGYLLADGVLYRWDFPANTLTPATDAPGCVHLTEFSPGEWALADTASVYRLRLPRVSRSRQ